MAAKRRDSVELYPGAACGCVGVRGGAEGALLKASHKNEEQGMPCG